MDQVNDNPRNQRKVTRRSHNLWKYPPRHKNHTLPLPNVSLTSESNAQLGVLWRKPEHQEKSSLWLLPEWHHPYLWASFESTRPWTVDEQIRLVPPSVCHHFRHFLFCITPRTDLLAIVKSWKSVVGYSLVKEWPRSKRKKLQIIVKNLIHVWNRLLFSCFNVLFATA